MSVGVILSAVVLLEFDEMKSNSSRHVDAFRPVRFQTSLSDQSGFRKLESVCVSVVVWMVA